MMQRIRDILTSRIAFLIYGWLAFAAFLLLAAALLELPYTLALAVLGGALLLGVMVWSWRRYRARRAARQLGGMLEQQAAAPTRSDPAPRHETEALRKRMVDAIQTIKTSKLGLRSGSAALYELPWYMIIGN